MPSLNKELYKVNLLLKASLESTNNILLAIDTEYEYLFFNESHKKTMKTVYNSDIEVGSNILNCITLDEDRRKAKKNYDLALSGQEHSVIEEYGDSLKLYYESHFKPIQNEEGTVIGVSASAANITEQKRAEEQLKKTNARHLEMIANIGDVIGIIGADGTIKYKSPNIEKWFGWKPEDLIGKDSLFTVHPDDAGFIREEFEEILKDETRQIKVEYRYQCKDQTYKWVELTAINCVSNQAIQGVLLNYHDISDKKKAQKDLEQSQAQYKALFENLNSSSSLYEVILNNEDKPCDYRFLAVNPAYEQSIGIKSKDLIGKTLIEVFPHTEASWLDTMHSTVISGEPLRIENYSGEIDRWFEITIFVPEKGLMAIIGSDVTERKKAEIALADEKERLAVTLRSIADGVITTDAQGRITMLNKAAENLTGWTNEEAAGQALLEVFNIVNEEGKIQCQNPVHKIMKSGTVDELETDIILITKTGVEIAIAESAAPLKDKEGKTIGVVLVFRDITEKKNVILQKQLLQEQMNQNQKMDAIGQLAGGIAHDFNNSLGGILGAAELIKSGDYDKEEQDQFLDLIISAAGRAGDLTKKLLMFSRKGNKASSTINMKKVLTETVGLLGHVLNKNITISIEDNAEYANITGDDSLLQNALMNLAINAGHAMPDGGQITFYSQNTSLDKEYCDVSPFDIEPGEYLEIGIQDTGEGISPEILPHIFEPFFTTKQQGQGTGLGLATVYGTVKDHNAAITVYSELNNGTVFNLFFKLSHDIERQSHSLELKKGSGTILVIDDEELIRITASAILKSLGYRVLNAENGLIGLEMFRERHNEIDLIILDMIMPVMGGRESFEKLREIDSRIPIIISSGFAKAYEMDKLKEQNISGFLHKPFTQVQISNIVSEVLSS